VCPDDGKSPIRVHNPPQMVTARSLMRSKKQEASLSDYFISLLDHQLPHTTQDRGATALGVPLPRWAVRPFRREPWERYCQDKRNPGFKDINEKRKG
jgi:hypothetical protein